MIKAPRDVKTVKVGINRETRVTQEHLPTLLKEKKHVLLLQSPKTWEEHGMLWEKRDTFQ